MQRRQILDEYFLHVFVKTVFVVVHGEHIVHDLFEFSEIDCISARMVDHMQDDVLRGNECLHLRDELLSQQEGQVFDSDLAGGGDNSAFAQKICFHTEKQRQRRSD